MFKGSFTALITPFDKGEISLKTYEKLIQRQIDEGTEGLVPCGTTGETPTFSEAEHLALVECAVKTAAGQIPVLAGAGSNSTAKTIELAKKITKLGADGLLIVTPYYNKPPQEALFQHYKAMHDATDIPILLYNVPGRTGIDMTAETVARLAKLPRIVGIKDATNDLTRPVKTRLLIGNGDFCQMSGEDATVVAFLAQGGHGCVSVSSNVAPKMCADLHKAWRAKDFATVSKLRDILQPLHAAMFCETNPGPCKYAMSLMGLCSAKMRQPLWEISDKSKQTVKDALIKTGLL